MSVACNGLCWGYGRRPVLEDVTFFVGKGEFCAVLGRNGSGKTTLLHCLCGLLQPDPGQVRLAGMDVAGATRGQIARAVSLMAQEQADIFPFRVLDVVVMGRTPHLSPGQVPGPADYDLAMASLAELRAESLAKRNFNRISGGERQMVMLARALTQNAPVMLLDEPTSHLDFNNQDRLLQRVHSLCHKHGITVVAAVHDPNLAGRFSDQVVMMHRGRVLIQGAADRVMTAENLGRLYQTDIRQADIPDGPRVFVAINSPD
ncbi:MAG: ABC transporter ATP-binding protein [Desulfobacterales bacterium]|nr:ABC transporter ATP-binding protein [Desulfobacterales bacterium]